MLLVLSIGEANLADIGQVPIALGKIDSVPHDKFIWDLEPDPIRAEIHLAAGRFVEQSNGFEARGLPALEEEITWFSV